MTNANKNKGSAWERAIVAFFREQGFTYVERAYGAGRPDDVGDISGLPGLVIEAKNHKTLDFSAWLREAEVERVNARADYGIVVAKRRNKPTSEAYVVMTLADFARLWRERDDL